MHTKSFLYGGRSSTGFSQELSLYLSTQFTLSSTNFFQLSLHFLNNDICGEPQNRCLFALLFLHKSQTYFYIKTPPSFETRNSYKRINLKNILVQEVVHNPVNQISPLRPRICASLHCCGAKLLFMLAKYGRFHFKYSLNKSVMLG